MLSSTEKKRRGHLRKKPKTAFLVGGLYALVDLPIAFLVAAESYIQLFNLLCEKPTRKFTTFIFFIFLEK